MSKWVARAIPPQITYNPSLSDRAVSQAYHRSVLFIAEGFSVTCSQQFSFQKQEFSCLDELAITAFGMDPVEVDSG